MSEYQGMDKSRMKLDSDHGWKWRPTHVHSMAAGISFVHLLCVFAPSTFTWPAFWSAVGMHILTGLFGMTLSYHRNLSHRSFNLPKWLEYFFAYCGVLAAQRDPIFWVSVHRHHHQLADTEKDPHSPVQGFWFSHIGWLFYGTYAKQGYRNRKNVEDLKKQAFYRFLERTYYWHPFTLWILLYAFGGFPFLVWVAGVRSVFGYHVTFLGTSVVHIWGKQAWNTGDLSKNNWTKDRVLTTAVWGFHPLVGVAPCRLVACFTFGEGWHNNHHAFEYSARQGLEWWQFDPTWYAILFLEAIGLATNVKLPTETQKKKKSF